MKPFITDIDYSLLEGFAWIVLEDADDEVVKEYTVQCCLTTCMDDPEAYEEAIVYNNCGHDWGICGGINQEAFDKFGADYCMSLLMNALNSIGIEIQ